MRQPFEKLEPAEVDPRKLRRTAWTLTTVMLLGGFLIYFAYLRAAEREAGDDRPSIVNRFKIGEDMALTLQDGSSARMSDWYGDVWLVCGISANQPESWQATREALKHAHEKYAGRSDFHILCLSIDPDKEGKDVLEALAKEVGATLPEWRVADAKQAEVHKFLKNTLKLQLVPEEKDGKWVYDSSITVIDRDLHLRRGTRRISTHRRQSFPFDFQEAAKLDAAKPQPDPEQTTTRKLEELLYQVIDYTLAQPITKS